MKSAALFIAPPRVFPISVGPTFTCEIQYFTKKFTHLSMIQSSLAFRDSPIIPLERSPIL